MAVKTAILTLTGGDMRFEAQVGSGHTIVLDDGESDTGSRPAELVGVALAGCTGMDVISILRKKRQVVTAYEVRTDGVQVDQHPHNFTRFDVTHVVSGDDVDEEAVRRAILLSATKYCSVGSTLASGALEIRHGYILQSADGAEMSSGEVLVIGPNELPEELAARA
jgi:putative redox protein